MMCSNVSILQPRYFSAPGSPPSLSPLRPACPSHLPCAPLIPPGNVMYKRKRARRSVLAYAMYKQSMENEKDRFPNKIPVVCSRGIPEQ